LLYNRTTGTNTAAKAQANADFQAAVTRGDEDAMEEALQSKQFGISPQSEQAAAPC
jgi:hypothetical protein